MDNPYAQIKAIERAELGRLTDYLRALDRAGWTEQSYCTDWLVYQVVSHIGSGSRIGGMRLGAWLGKHDALAREDMQRVWAHFDSLPPDAMLAAYSEAVEEYLQMEAATPDDAGVQEVEGFAGKRPLYAYQLGRLWELACHSWDIYVARDRTARLAPDAVRLLSAQLHFVGVIMDAQRAPAVRVGFRLTDTGHDYLLDPALERPRLQPGLRDCPLVLEAPAEEIIRLTAGRHFLPGTQPTLRVASGSPEDAAAVRRAFRP